MLKNGNRQFAISLVKTLVKSGQYRLTDHAYIRMEEREITEEQIEECIVFGDILKVQDHGKDIKLKIKSKDKDIFVIVTAICNPDNSICAVIITCAHTLEDLESDSEGIGNYIGG